MVFTRIFYLSLAPFFCGGAVHNVSDSLHPSPRSKINKWGYSRKEASQNHVKVGSRECDQHARTLCGTRDSTQHYVGREDWLTLSHNRSRWPREGTHLPERWTRMPQPSLSRCSLKLIRCCVSDVRSKEGKGKGRAGSCRPMSTGLELG